jgi:hypothetical protein
LGLERVFAFYSQKTGDLSQSRGNIEPVVHE